MKKQSARKAALDQQRTEWRRTHRTLNGRVILYPNGTPEHINARGSQVYNWFWRKILLEVQPQEIPAIISALQDKIKATQDQKKIQVFRTMIGMADDAYHLKQLEGIKEFDTELQFEKKPYYDTEEGVIYNNGTIATTDYNEDESGILLRDIEGIIVDVLSSDDTRPNQPPKNTKNNVYKSWRYTTKS
ncbi:MAG TPA: acetyltransferase [Candidatus Thermoplasmatota archaeon]|nr:acetyltransferase [Candidatus Thermoplasmatota archaeon]